MESDGYLLSDLTERKPKCSILTLYAHIVR